MRGYVIRSRTFKLTVNYLIQRPSGLYYFRRVIPEELRKHYGKREINRSLKTYDRDIAIKKVQVLARETDKDFARLRSSDSAKIRELAVAELSKAGLKPAPKDEQEFDLRIDGNPYEIYMDRVGQDLEVYEEGHDGYYLRYEDPPPVIQRTIDILEDSEPLTLEEAELLALSNAGEDTKKRNTIKLHFRTFRDLLIKDDIQKIKRAEVQEAANQLTKQGYKSATIRRYLATVSAATNSLKVLREVEDNRSPFTKVKIQHYGKDNQKGETATPDQLTTIAEMIKAKPDLDSSKVIALLLNTGCRISEITGLSLANLNTEHQIPHVIITEQPNRGLKTRNSERIIPLIGISLAVAKRIKNAAKNDDVYCFPRWNKNNVLSNDAASTSVNKAIRKVCPGITSHSIRHTLSTRLKEADVSEENREALGGWEKQKMVLYYGKPKSLKLLSKAMTKMIDHEKSEESEYITP